MQSIGQRANHWAKTNPSQIAEWYHHQALTASCAERKKNGQINPNDKNNAQLKTQDRTFHMYFILTFQQTMLNYIHPNTPTEQCAHHSLARDAVIFTENKVYGANVGPIWGRHDPGGPPFGPMNIAIWVTIVCCNIPKYFGNARDIIPLLIK